MESVQSDYRKFHRALWRFEDEFLYKVKVTCPEPLWKITKLHLILSPDDEDFDVNKAERLGKKLRLVLELTRKVLGNIGPYLKPGEQWWLRAKSKSLEVLASIVVLNCVNLKLDNMDVPEASSAGVGSLNLVEIDTRRLIDEELSQDITQLVNVLG